METFLRSSSSWFASFIGSENESSSVFEGFSSNEVLSNTCSATDISSATDIDVEVQPFFNITYNSTCTTIQVDPDKFQPVANIINCNLTLIRSDATNGNIFKSSDFQVTVTLYKSTNKIHVQGKESAKWLSVFLPLCDDIENTDLKTVYTTQCSTPITGNNINLSILDASLIESTSEIVLLKNQINKLQQQLDVLENNKVKQVSVYCQTDSLPETSSINLQQTKGQIESHDANPPLISVTSSSCQTDCSSPAIGCQTVDIEVINIGCQTSSERPTELSKSDSVILITDIDETSNKPQSITSRSSQRPIASTSTNVNADKGSKQNNNNNTQSKHASMSMAETLIIGSSIVKTLNAEDCTKRI